MDWSFLNPVSAIVSPLTSLIAGGLNLYSQKKTNELNYQMSQEANNLTRENNEWQKQMYYDNKDWQMAQYFDQKQTAQDLTNQVFAREDNAHQRAVADLQAAGISPIALTGGANAGNPVNQPNTPNFNVPELQSITPFQAQSLNFGQLADIIGQADSRQIERARLDFEERKELSDKEYREAQATEQTRQFNETLTLERDKLNQQVSEFERSANLEDTKEAHNYEIQQKNINHLNDLLKLENSKTKNDYVLRVLHSINPKAEVSYCKTEQQYHDEMSVLRQAQIEHEKAKQKYIAENYSSESIGNAEAKGGSGSLGFGTKIKKVLPLDANASGSYNQSTSENKSYSKEVLAHLQSMDDEFWAKHKVPVYYRD